MSTSYDRIAVTLSHGLEQFLCSLVETVSLKHSYSAISNCCGCSSHDLGIFLQCLRTNVKSLFLNAGRCHGLVNSPALFVFVGQVQRDFYVISVLLRQILRSVQELLEVAYFFNVDFCLYFSGLEEQLRRHSPQEDLVCFSSRKYVFDDWDLIFNL